MTARSELEMAHYCGVCRGSLDRLVTDGVTTWLHGRADQHARGIEPHEPVPVPVREMHDVVTYCDFCSDPEPRWVIVFNAAASILNNTDAPNEHYGSVWLADERCRELLTTGQLAGLLARVRAAFRRRGHVLDPRDEQLLDEMYRGLWATGLTATRLVPGDPIGQRVTAGAA